MSDSDTPSVQPPPRGDAPQNTPDVLSREDELRAEIRRELEQQHAQHHQHRELRGTRDADEDRRLEAQLQGRLRREEEEKYHTSRGYVCHTNRYGQKEWVTPAEARRRQRLRRQRVWSGFLKGERISGQTRRNILTGCLLLCAALALAAGAVLLSRGPARYGSLMVESDPPGARIYIDGEAHGDTTPQVVGNLREGHHVIVIAREGFISKPPVLSVNVTPGTVAQARFQLTSVPLLGRVTLAANLTDKVVLYMDALPCPLDTQLAAAVPVGYHVFTPVCTGFLAEPAYRRVLVDKAPSLTLTFEFTRQKEHGGLEVIPDSDTGAGRYIYLDGRFTGFPVVASSALPVRPGKHEVRIPANGSRTIPARQTVTVVAGRTCLASFKIVPAAQDHPVRLTTRTPGAAVILDGTWLNHLTPMAELQLSAGDHFVNLCRDGRFYAEQDVALNTVLDKEGHAYFDF